MISHNRDFGGFNDFLISVINSKDKKSSQKTFLYYKFEEIMDFVDRIHKIINNELSEDEIKKIYNKNIDSLFY
jgi:hypothetical protein